MRIVPAAVRSAGEGLEEGLLVVAPVEEEPRGEAVPGPVEVDHTVSGPVEADHKVSEVAIAEEHMAKAVQHMG